MMRNARGARVGLCLGRLASFETPAVGRLLMTRSLFKTPGGGCVGGQLKIFGSRENVMKNLLFFTAAALLLVESTVAYSEHGDTPSERIIERTNKWDGGERFPALPQAAVIPDCHNVKVRIGTHNGHAVYKTQRICG